MRWTRWGQALALLLAGALALATLTYTRAPRAGYFMALSPTRWNDVTRRNAYSTHSGSASGHIESAASE